MNLPQMTPYLCCQDLKGSLEWFQKLGFKAHSTMNCPMTGNPMHAEISREGMHFMLGSPRPGMDWEKPGSSVGFYMTMGGKDFDLDGLCAELKAKGVQVSLEPMDQFYGHRTFTVVHPEGFTFTFGKLMEMMTMDEMGKSLEKMMAGAK